MTRDHGYPVRLGVAVDPSVLTPDGLTRLARTADEAGLDLLAVTDAAAGEASGPSGPDPWTTLAWLAGTTDRITLATHALAPTGTAAVLARAAADLDRITGGRLELGLTAVPTGAASPALGVQPHAGAVGETIAVLRSMWTADRGPVRAAGPLHRVPGAEPGPAPAHELPVWLSGTDEALLDLAARTADGWWTEAPDPTTVAAAQSRLDAAADRAGRDPAEIRRLLTLATLPDLPALVRLVVEDGIDTVLLATTDPATVQHLATAVAPALRDLVAATRRSRGTRPAPTRPARVRARRRAGIDYDDVPAGLETVEPGDARYRSMRSNYLRGGSPGLVLLPRDTEQVVTALGWARSQPVPLAVRSGGHGISGRSTNDGGIVLDLRHLDAVEVLDHRTRRVRIGPGARWGQVAETLQPYGWALTSGDYGGVGVGGLATAGGLGFLARQHGLTIDHLRAAEVVLADGTVVRTDEEHHPDLFWGLRGAGGNLGIVTAFEFEVAEVGDVGFAQLAFAVDDVAGFLVDFGALVETAPRDLTPFLIMGRPRGGQVLAQVMAVVASDDPETIVARLQPFARLAPLVQQLVQLLPYSGVVQRTDDVHAGQGEPVTRSAMLEHLSPQFADDAERLLRSGDLYFFQIRSVGGAVNDVPAGATAYAHRTAGFQAVALGTSRERLDRRWDAMSHHFSGIYSSFETDRRPERLAEIFPGPTLARLRALKDRYDPEDVFGHNHSVAAAGVAAPASRGRAASPPAPRPA
ncbi:LLM class flavin-dependent oxidoreductase [Auraticoccus sp. F435]|uniref:LLM class flavin-dependent oxidoreductase n=1 Tax=Auraticoccus cholistanensis TaxID=2656650 RepID=A0A6A9V0C2_9ACTN|nr:LLM class flavin-dependent oxidoreductase [Auraticoccus cholistanensis]MVA75339.1 LLM class flavin-dependent oxidoreductase [Auraticoccus cholistanensis]